MRFYHDIPQAATGGKAIDAVAGPERLSEQAGVAELWMGTLGIDRYLPSGLELRRIGQSLA